MGGLALALVALGAAPGASALPAAAAPAAVSASTAPHPVAPTVKRVAVSGVDASALQQAPAALDPGAVRRAAATQSKVGAAADVPQPTARAAATARPAVFTGQLEVGQITTAGLSWVPARSDDAAVVQVRLREQGRWSDWEVLDLAAGPDPTSAEGRAAAGRVSTEPISSGSADAVQVRVDTTSGAAPTDLQLVTVDPGTSAADAALPVPSASASAVPSLAPAAGAAPAGAGPVQAPTIYSRAQWGADESLLGLHGPCPGLSSTVKVGFVHHTVGSNSYSAAQAASVIRGVYAYHVQGNGWCDIGYNFLVDRYGRVFEGRHGGVAAAVTGAHTLSFNTDSFGVAAMGTFSSVAAPAAMTSSIAAVVGWKLSLFARYPLGTEVLVSGGGAGAKYPGGTPVRFNVVSGHRDGYSTECPGNVLYGQLGAIRTGATSYIATHETGGATVPSLLPAGASVTTPNGRYQLVMQTNGNLVQYATGGPSLWNSHTTYPGSVLRVQADGNAVVYGTSDGLPLWSTGSSGAGGRLVLQNNGNLVLYAASGAARWDSQGHVGRSTRYDPQKRVTSLASGASTTSYNGAYRLIMQRDGNLVVTTSNGTPSWWTGSNSAGSRVVAQSDGNLVVYTRTGAPAWYAGVASPGATTRLQNDGNLVIYDAAGRAVWDARGHLGRQGHLVV